MPRKPGSSNPEALKDQGNKCFMQGRFTDAVQNYTKAINLDDTNHIYFANRANAYLRLQEFQLALEDCEKAIEIKNDYPKVSETAISMLTLLVLF